MSISSALRRLLYSTEEESQDLAWRGHHHSGSYDALLHTSTLYLPAAALPRSGLSLAVACLATTFVGCLSMKKRSSEKYWIGLFMMSGLYYTSVKAHKVNNGLVGHQSGFFAACLGAAGAAYRSFHCPPRARLRARLAVLACVAMMWYEIGRFHVWSDHCSEFRKEATPERAYNLLDEYLPGDVVTAFLPFRGIAHADSSPPSV